MNEIKEKPFHTELGECTSGCRRVGCPVQECKGCGEDHDEQKCPQIAQDYKDMECNKTRDHIFECDNCKNYFEPIWESWTKQKNEQQNG